ncbi:MAG: TIGR02099 family protein [Gammaproteobacteria bacterium]|nr:TIGR02099 family protein [Gammaproteobacteria bacterium]MBU1480913.1 TIGR02099 family protein [Gammaproteobacteria bacterium]
MGKISRYMLELFLILAIAGALLLLTLRYRILPNIERYHDQITAAASATIGQPLLVGRIAADWDGLRPRLLLSNVQILDKQGKVALSLPRLENTVAWTSLPTMELRFYSLLIDSPELSVRRDAQGHWFVAGIELGAPSAGGQDGLDWMLHQSRVVIQNARITWQDELRAAPTLVLEKVDLSIDNRRWRHRFALRASAPAKLASRLDVRGNFSGDSFADMSDWRGELYSQLEYADVLAWKSWVTLPNAIRRGKGALRMWLGFKQGKLRSVDADVALAGVQARLSEELPQLDLKELRGRIGWQSLERGFEVSTRKLALQMRDGFELKPTDFHLRLQAGADGQPSSGEIRANALRLGGFVRMMSYLPLNNDFKERWVNAQPRGQITDLRAQWQGNFENISRYEIKARFDGMSMRRVGNLPGFSGLSGKVEGAENGGTLSLDSVKLSLDAPQLFSEPVAFDKLTARLGWQRNAHGLEVRLSNAELSNADLAGTIYGSYQFEPDGPGSVDATVDMTRVAVQRTGLYTPVPAVNRKTRDWLQAALQGGQADRFHVRLRGDLRDFPFVGNERGIFRLEARAKGVVMEFVKGWPRLEDAQMQLLIEGKKLEIKAVTATTTGAHLQNVKVSIPDLLVGNPLLQVRGEAADSTQRCLDYILKSPVNGYLNGFTEGIKASGDGKLKLQLDIPLKGDEPVKVRGDYHFVNNEIDIGENVPLLRNVNGVLLFTESSVNAGDINAQILGGAAHLMVQGDKSALQTKAHGTLDLDNLNTLAPHPLLRRVHGSTDWKADIRVQNKLVDVTVDSDLQGIQSDLPAPLSKIASERVPLHFEQKGLDLRQQTLGLSVGSLLDASLLRRRDTEGAWIVRGGRIAFGGTAGRTGRYGIRVAGKLPSLSLEGWSGLGLVSGSEGVIPNIAGIDVVVDKLTGYGNTVNDLEIKGSGRNGLISLRLASRELNGDLIWQPQGNGKILGRFKDAMLGEGHGEPSRAVERETGKVEPPDNSAFPEVDMEVEKLTYKGRQLGKLEMALSEDGGDVLLDRLLLTNPDGVLNMSGKWQAVPEQTRIKLRIDISDAGNILSRSGYPDSLKDGSGSLESDLHWAGAPGTFSYPKLNGTLQLKVGKGRFLKVDPGAAKLLGVLSLQRLSLDFTDVFSKGFQFESITGNAQIVNGLLLTDDMKLTGAAAKVTLNGQVDLNRETQELKVRILPTIGDNVSLLSFAAGPVVGVGVLLANKILRDPLDKLVSFEYNVSGSWADPKVEKVGQSKPAQSAVVPGE